MKHNDYKIGDVFIYMLIPTNSIQIFKIYEIYGHLYRIIDLNNKLTSICDSFYLKNICTKIKHTELIDILYGI